MKPYHYALLSMLLVSSAHLIFRKVMLNFPEYDLHHFDEWYHFIKFIGIFAIGLLAYLLSMICWLVAIRHLPLSTIYPVLSLSYPLVWVASIILPSFHESFNWISLIGLIFICVGVYCVLAPQNKHQNIKAKSSIHSSEK